MKIYVTTQAVSNEGIQYVKVYTDPVAAVKAAAATELWSDIDFLVVSEYDLSSPEPQKLCEVIAVFEGPRNVQI